MTMGLVWGLMKSSTARAWEPLVDRTDVRILDAETTGFEYDSELVEIAIVDSSRNCDPNRGSEWPTLAHV